MLRGGGHHRADSSAACGPNDPAAAGLGGGVSRLSYRPKPFYSDLRTMTVQFTTTGSAGRGCEYFVVLEAISTRDDDCAYVAIHPDDNKAARILGGPGKKYKVGLNAEKSHLGLYDYFVPATTVSAFGTTSIRHPSRKTLRWQRTLQFRIFRAPVRDWRMRARTCACARAREWRLTAGGKLPGKPENPINMLRALTPREEGGSLWWASRFRVHLRAMQKVASAECESSFRLTPLYWGVIPAPQNTPLPLAVAGLECTSGCEKAPVSRDVRVRYGLMKTACGLRSRRTRTSPARGPGRPPH